MPSSKTISKSSICVIGIGSSIRSDDGIGHYICDQLEKMKQYDVEIYTSIQLDPALAETIKNYKHVIIVDAAVENNQHDVQLYPLNNQPLLHQSNSHHFDAETLAAISSNLYKQHTDFYVCSVKGYYFELGTLLSESALANAERATDLIIELIKKLIAKEN